MTISEKDMHRYYEIYDAFGDQAAARFLERKEVGNMDVENINAKRTYLDLILERQLERGLSLEQRIEADKNFDIYCAGDGTDKILVQVGYRGYGTDDDYSERRIPCRHSIEPKPKSLDVTDHRMGS